ncbi:MAG: hypothetical protein PHT40_01205 [Patescibacteria group bacterium]|nr:hypothetical protein [Patescibacteria group bacterium]
MCPKCREEGKPGGCPLCHRHPWPEPRTDVLEGASFVFLRNARVGGDTIKQIMALRQGGIQGIFLEYVRVYAPHRPDLEMPGCVGIWAEKGIAETVSKMLGFENSENN